MMIKSTFNAALVRPILLAYAGAIVLVIAIALAVSSCYPKNCDPKTDPLQCHCPPGACGPYPDPPAPPPVRGSTSDRSDAGAEAGR